MGTRIEEQKEFSITFNNGKIETKLIIPIEQLHRTSILVGTRHFFYSLLVAVIFCGCVEQTQKEQPQEKQVTINQKNLADSRYEILILDSCEYIVFAWIPRDDHVITHKGNCKFCAERSKK